MTVERDIAGISIPFTVGTALTLYRGIGPYTAVGSYFFLSAIFICTIILLHPSHKNICYGGLWVLVMTLALLCGLLTGGFGNMTGLCTCSSDSILSNAATDFCSRMKLSIDSVPFEDTQVNAIIKAVTTGDRSDLTRETTSAFRQSGASHILALSGMHLGIIYGILKGLLSVIGNSFRRRITKALITISFCGFYTVATGAGASITRAFLFVLLGETASLTGRFRSTGSVLLTALLLQILHEPTSLKEVGFQLSYAAMAGIAWIFPFLKNIWPSAQENEGIGGKILRYVWYSAAMSIACQITTGPIAYLYFGTFPHNFILTNLISIPLVGIIIPASLAVILLNSFGFCPAWLVYMTEAPVRWLIESLKIICEM